MLEPDDPRHGTYNGYINLGCRCEPCREAHRVEHLRYMHAHPAQVERHREYMRDRRAKQRAERTEGNP